MISSSNLRTARRTGTPNLDAGSQPNVRAAVRSECCRIWANTALLAAVFWGPAGCSTAKPIPVREMTEYPNRRSISTVSVAAEAFHAPQTRKVFNHGINEKGFLPVLIVVRNDDRVPIIINASDIRLRDAWGEVHWRVPARVLAGNFERSPGWEAVLLFGLLSFMDADRWNAKLHADWQDKELANRVVLQPHSTAYRFVYFELPKREQKNKLSVIVPIINGEKKYNEVVLEL